LSKLLLKELYPFYLFFILLTICVAHNAFFWDTIQLGSKHAYFYYQNNLKLTFLPDELDSGHIPAFGYILASLWKIFGKSLPVGHYFMLPFLIGIVYQLWLLIRHYFSKENLYLVGIILLVDPTLLAQATLVTPDIPLVFFFLLLLNAIINYKPILKTIAVFCLALVSMRGMMAAAILFIFDNWILLRYEHKKNYLRKIFSNLSFYIPGGLIVLIFLSLHYIVKGWIGYHSDSPWAPSFEPVNITWFLRNIFIYGWRLIDFGRIILWVLFILMVKKWRSYLISDHKAVELFVLAGLFILIFPISMITHKYLMAHRYLMPVYLSFSLMLCYLFFEKTRYSFLKKKIVAFLLITTLIAGNFIVYPDKIAKGWDSSLAYIPYLRLRDQAIDYLKSKKIPINEIGSSYPNLASFKYIDLKESDEGFVAIDLQRNKYFLYSNVFNDISDSEYNILHTKWIIEKNYEKVGVRVTIFKNPED
jgi:hypothetical protein